MAGMIETSDGTQLVIKEAHVEYPPPRQASSAGDYRVIVNAGDIIFRSDKMTSSRAHGLLWQVNQGGTFDENILPNDPQKQTAKGI